MESKEMRAVFAETLVSLAQADERIVLIDADLGKAAATGSFASAFPTRKINVGVAEANMIGVAAGMASAGKIPFAQTFACFASRRVFDQFFISAAYAHLGVKLIGTDPGIAAAYNGGTHMPFEDIGIMRTVPLLPILEPSDPVSLAALLRASATFEGPTYLRMYRKPLPVRYSRDEKFEIGKSKILHDGGKGAVVLLALGGIMLGEALGAADLLAQEGIATTVIDVLSVKPLDSELLLSLARTLRR
ncbi:transketolase family protein [Treponema sp.]